MADALPALRDGGGPGIRRCRRPASSARRSRGLLIAEPALDVGADARVAFVVVKDPRSEAKGRIVTDVLAVAARQLGHPRARLVLTEGDDRPIHEPDLTFDRCCHMRGSVVIRVLGATRGASF